MIFKYIMISFSLASITSAFIAWKKDRNEKERTKIEERRNERERAKIEEERRNMFRNEHQRMRQQAMAQLSGSPGKVMKDAPKIEKSDADLAVDDIIREMNPDMAEPAQKPKRVVERYGAGTMIPLDDARALKDWKDWTVTMRSTAA